VVQKGFCSHQIDLSKCSPKSQNVTPKNLLQIYFKKVFDSVQFGGGAAAGGI
jgi:hypothetical protein